MLLEAMLAHLGAMLGYVGPAGRHLGATWRQDEAQERQDSARWRTRAPRRGKIGELRRRGLLLEGSDPRDEPQVPACTPLRMDSPEWVSRLRLQLELDLEIWKTGGLENWRTGYRALCIHCTRNCACGTVADIYIYIYCIYIYIYCMYICMYVCNVYINI